MNDNQTEFLNFVHKSEFFDADLDSIDKAKFPNKLTEIYENTKDTSIFPLFPYVSSDYDSKEAITEIRES